MTEGETLYMVLVVAAFAAFAISLFVQSMSAK
jgi:hypothetical protein